MNSKKDIIELVKYLKTCRNDAITNVGYHKCEQQILNNFHIVAEALLIAVEALEHYRNYCPEQPCDECKVCGDVADDALYHIRSLPL